MELAQVASQPLGDFDPDAPASGPAADLIAGVMQRFDGPLAGSALFALDPGDALLWLQLGDEGGAPLDRFVDWGSRVLAAIVECTADTLQLGTEHGEPALVEEALLAALLGTHAPSDTMVLSLQGSLAFPVANLPEIRAPFGVHLLLDPKRVARILDALAH